MSTIIGGVNNAALAALSAVRTEAAVAAYRAPNGYVVGEE
jgi:hypothetical protein